MKASRVENLELERALLDSQINTLRFLEALDGASGGDVRIVIGEVEVIIDSTEIGEFSEALTGILGGRL